MKVSKAQIKEALKKNAGLLSQSAQALGIDRSSLYERIKNDPELQKVKEDAEETILDMAEGVLIKKIRENDSAQAQFVLKTKGRKRGYIEKTEVEHSGEIRHTEQKKKVKNLMEKYGKVLDPSGVPAGSGKGIARKRKPESGS